MAQIEQQPPQGNDKAKDLFGELRASWRQIADERKIAKEKDRSDDQSGSGQTLKDVSSVNPRKKFKRNALAKEFVGDGAFVKLGDDFVLSKSMYKRLYWYQRDGIRWLYGLFQSRNGGILADDMGLGKTVQTIVFVKTLLDCQLIKKALVVVPKSLLENWQAELRTWAPRLPLVVFHGSNKAKRAEHLNKMKSSKGICLTTYALAGSCEVTKLKWDYVILDEGHLIKNSATKTNKMLHEIPSQHRLILTGTPIQNNLTELWALFDFVSEGMLLGNRGAFRSCFSGPIEKAREKDATDWQRHVGTQRSKELQAAIAPFIMRRTKAEVLVKKNPPATTGSSTATASSTVATSAASSDLLPLSLAGNELGVKTDLIVWIYLSDIQLKLYDGFLKLDSVKRVMASTHSPLVYLTVLKKLCDHPRLMCSSICKCLGLDGGAGIPDFEFGSLETEELKETTYSPGIAGLPSPEVLMAESGKLAFVSQLMDKLRGEGHKTLIFSRSRVMLDIIEKVLGAEGHLVLRIDGTINSISERERIINKFQTEPCYTALLLTTQVGSLGLNLIAANRAIIVDPSWNPASDAQAIDRLYRIGQKRDVIVYRLITCGSVEEKIYRRQVFKDSLAKQTTGASKDPMRYFTSHQLRELFLLEDPKSSLTQRHFEEVHGQQKRFTDEALDHIKYLMTLGIFGTSDHTLLFSLEDPNPPPAVTPADAQGHFPVASSLLPLAFVGEASATQEDGKGKELKVKLSSIEAVIDDDDDLPEAKLKLK